MEQYGVHGNNENGTLGNGTNKNTKTVTQVKIDENTYLNNIIKIANGKDHVLALSKERYSICMGTKCTWRIRKQ